MRIQNPKRTLFIGIVVWLLFFGWWFRGYLFRNWQFRLFSFKSWKYLINEFKAGWHISSKSDWIFLFSFILAPFIFALLWYLAQKVKWRKLWQKIWKIIRWPFLAKKRKKLNQETAAYAPKKNVENYPTYRPYAMPMTANKTQTKTVVTQKTFLNNSTAMGDFPVSPVFPEQKFVNPEASYQPTYETPKVEPFTNEALAQMADTPISEIEIPKTEAVKEDISSLLEEKGYVQLGGISGENVKADFMAVSASELLVGMYDSESGDWLADEESFNDEDPLWFSETDHRISPVFELLTTSKTIQQKLGEMIKVVPVLIEREGTIINAEDMMKTWNDLGVRVCRTNIGGPVELPTVTELLKESQEKISEESLEKIKSIL